MIPNQHPDRFTDKEWNDLYPDSLRRDDLARKPGQNESYLIGRTLGAIILIAIVAVCMYGGYLLNGPGQ